MLLRLATRGSPLALWQAGHVADLVRAAQPGTEVELVTVSTRGDRQSSTPVWEMGGQGVFVREVQAAVVEGRADAAVHSAKDLQPVDSPGLCLAAVPARADPRDALVGCALADLALGATVATGSQRRRAQLAAARPDLQFESLRGNIATRLGRAPAGGALVVAQAALDRLGLHPEPIDVLSTDVMLPQVAQGALAVECREHDQPTLALLGLVDEPRARACVQAERAYLAALGGGCDLPVAGFATVAPDGQMRVEGLVAAVDGRHVVRRVATGPSSEGTVLGREVARMVLAEGGQDLVEQARRGQS